MSDNQPPSLDERMSEFGRILIASMPSIAALTTVATQQAIDHELQAVINAYNSLETLPIDTRAWERILNPTEQDMIDSILAKRDIKVG